MRTQSIDTPCSIERVQVEMLRRAGLDRRLALAMSLSDSVIGLARAAIRRVNPGWDEADVLLKFVEVHYGAPLAVALRADLARRRDS